MQPPTVRTPRLITIDVQGNTGYPLHITNVIWQELFRLYREAGCDVDWLYDLLCDHNHIERLIERGEGLFLLFFWSHGDKGDDMTTLNTYDDGQRNTYRVDYWRGQGKINIAWVR